MVSEWYSPIFKNYTCSEKYLLRLSHGSEYDFESILHEWGFQKAEIARAISASAISAYWKILKCKLISNWKKKTVWLLTT